MESKKAISFELTQKEAAALTTEKKGQAVRVRTSIKCGLFAPCNYATSRNTGG
jgi:hypothetical protein